MKMKIRGGFKKTRKDLHRMSKLDVTTVLNRAGREGVNRLKSQTPIDTGETANSWSYEIKRSGDSYTVVWTNSKMVGDTPLVILLHYGHGTGTGGYVAGTNFIDAGLEGLLEELNNDIRVKVNHG